MTNHIIKTDEAYENAWTRIEQIMDAEPNTPEGDELELLIQVCAKFTINLYKLYYAYTKCISVIQFV